MSILACVQQQLVSSQSTHSTASSTQGIMYSNSLDPLMTCVKLLFAVSAFCRADISSQGREPQLQSRNALPRCQWTKWTLTSQSCAGVFELTRRKHKWLFVLEAVGIGGLVMFLGAVVDRIGYGR